jgi:hypothetical protein
VRIVGFDGKHFRLVSERAFAPGYPLPLVAELGGPTQLDLKSLGSRLRPDGSFDVRARAQTLRRETREKLVAALSTQA